jgi:hypothetical protein
VVLVVEPHFDNQVGPGQNGAADLIENEDDDEYEND